METIRTGTKGEIVKALQQLLTENGCQTAQDGKFGKATSQAVRAFQRRQGLVADGIVGYRTWEALFFTRRNQGTRLTRGDFELTARLIGCSTAALMAVKEVETGSQGGFLPSGKPVILFEGHIFWNQLKQRGIDPESCRAGHEDILYPSWSRKYYLGAKRNTADWNGPGKSTGKRQTPPPVGACSRLWDSITRPAANRRWPAL